DARLARGGRAAVERHALADGVVVAHDEARALAGVLQVLRRDADVAARVQAVVLAERRDLNDRVRANGRARADNDVLADDRVRADLRRGIDLRRGVDDRGRVDVLRHEGRAHCFGASAKDIVSSVQRLPSMYASPFALPARLPMRSIST